MIMWDEFEDYDQVIPAPVIEERITTSARPAAPNAVNRRADAAARRAAARRPAARRTNATARLAAARPTTAADAYTQVQEERIRNK